MLGIMMDTVYLGSIIYSKTLFSSEFLPKSLQTLSTMDQNMSSYALFYFIYHILGNMRVIYKTTRQFHKGKLYFGDDSGTQQNRTQEQDSTNIGDHRVDIPQQRFQVFVPVTRVSRKSILFLEVLLIAISIALLTQMTILFNKVIFQPSESTSTHHTQLTIFLIIYSFTLVLFNIVPQVIYALMAATVSTRQISPLLMFNQYQEVNSDQRIRQI
eukprot:403336817